MSAALAPGAAAARLKLTRDELDKGRAADHVSHGESDGVQDEDMIVLIETRRMSKRVGGTISTS